MKKNNPRKSNFAPVVIGILVFILLGLSLGIVGKAITGRDRKIYIKEDSFGRYVQYGEYDSIDYYIHDNEFRMKNESSLYQQYRAMSEYMDGSLLYNAYTVEGDSNKASEYKKAMDDAASKMGNFDYLTKDLDERIQKVLDRVARVAADGE